MKNIAFNKPEEDITSIADNSIEIVSDNTVQSTENIENQNEILKSNISGADFENLVSYVQQIGHENFSFKNIIIENKIYSVLKKIRPDSYPNKIIPTVEKFVSLYEQIKLAGFDGKPDDLLIRWVEVNNDGNDIDYKKLVEDVVTQSQINGGARDKSEKGLNMSTIGSKADDYFANNIMTAGGGVIFLYDGRKLTRLSDDERSSDTNFVAGYGYKPKENESYRKALLAVMEFVK